MKKIFIAGTLTLLLASCSKTKEDKPGNPVPGGSISRISTWTGDNGINTYTYDASGRCIRVENTSGSKTTYDYSPGKMVQKQFNPAGVNTATYEYTINASGLVEKETRPLDPDFQQTRIYDADKKMIKTVTLSNGNTQVMDYFYSNGNEDSVRFTNNGNWSLTVIRTYYPDLTNSLNYNWYGMTIYGAGSKNLVKSEQYTYPDGTKLDPTNYKYELDASGRVIKKTSTQGGNMEISYITYQ